MLYFLLLLAGCAAAPPSDDFLIACARGAPSCAHIWDAPVPQTFTATIPTPHGPLSVFVNSTWAPAMAARFYVLTALSYSAGGPFYRVLRRGGQAFVAQWGYRASPAVDAAWLSLRTLNTTSRVLLSNTRGTVAFGTGEQANSGQDPNCTAPVCSRGFSVELFINLDDNSRLDAMGFSPFGRVAEADMAPADALYAGYGECADVCAEEVSPYCIPASHGGWKGVNLSAMLREGRPYLARFPLLDFVR